MWCVDQIQGRRLAQVGLQTWGGGSDSYFEYLIKYARLSNTPDNVFTDSWLTAVDTSIKTLMKVSRMCQHNMLRWLLTHEKTSTVGNHVYLADYDDQKQIRHVGSHLECFLAGNWLLGDSADIR